MRAGVPVSSYNFRSGGAGAGVSGLTTANAGDAIADNEVIRGDGTTGIQGSVATLTDLGALSGVTTISATSATLTSFAQGGNLRLTGNILSSQDANGNINLDPDGTGNVQIVSGLLQFEGATSAFPALKRNSTRLEVRLADDSSYAPLTIQTAGVALAFGGTGATNAAIRPTAGAVPLVEFITGTQSAYANIAAARLTLNGTTVGLFTGAGTPEGAVTAGIGSIFLRTDGGAGTSAYIKESGTGNTGWKALVGI